MAGNRQLPLLLVLAALGAALILYRLALIGERHSKPGPDPNQSRGGSREPRGELVWTKRIVAVGDLHGGKLTNSGEQAAGAHPRFHRFQILPTRRTYYVWPRSLMSKITG